MGLRPGIRSGPTPSSTHRFRGAGARSDPAALTTSTELVSVHTLLPRGPVIRPRAPYRTLGQGTNAARFARSVAVRGGT